MLLLARDVGRQLEIYITGAVMRRTKVLPWCSFGFCGNHFAGEFNIINFFYLIMCLVLLHGLSLLILRNRQIHSRTYRLVQPNKHAHSFCLIVEACDLEAIKQTYIICCYIGGPTMKGRW